MFSIFEKHKYWRIEHPTGLPIYMTNKRNFFRVEHNNCSFVVVTLSGNDPNTIAGLKNQYDKYEIHFDCPVVYGMHQMCAAQRAAFIRNGIPFISNGKRYFLPFLGIEDSRITSISSYFGEYPEDLESKLYKTIWLEKKDCPEDLPLAGESALAALTMLSEPKITVYAAQKDDERFADITSLHPKWDADRDLVCIQLWNNLKLDDLNKGIISIDSLYESLKGCEDERVQKELEKIVK